jgi:UMF1 family MFS transporter
VLRFLVAFVLYTNGVETVVGIAAVYAVGTLRLAPFTILVVFVAVQTVAVPGAFAFAAYAARVGTRAALLVSLSLWVVIVVAAYFLEPGAVTGFCVLGLGVGFVQGGTHSLARSLYGSMIPEAASAQLYAVFSIFSRLSAVLGPLVFAAVSDASGSARTGVLSLIVFFVGGGLVLASVNVEKARAERAWSSLV